MRRIERSALVNFTHQQMFDLVNDVHAYPLYMDGCVGSKVLEQSETHMVARLDLSKAGVTQSFTTRNQLTPHSSILLDLEEGPFSRFKGGWQFVELGQAASKVVFELEFDVQSRLVRKAMDTLLSSVASNMVDALTQRAAIVYR